MNRVIVIGSINDDVVTTAERHPRPGETVRGSGLAHFPGGKGANQAVAASRAGAPTSMIAAVGGDAAGANLVDYLVGAGVDVAGVSRHPSEPTGTAIITVAGGENTIVVIAGANGTVGPGALDEFEFEASDLVVAQYETPLPTTIEAFRRARAVGARTILNPAPMEATPHELLEATTVLVVNEHEFEDLFGHPIEQLLETPEERRVITGDAFQGALVVTLGSSGVAIWSGSEFSRIEGLSVAAVDSTGAGDCFVGYLAAGLGSGLSIEEAGRKANAAAALSVTRPGAAASIPTLAEVG